MLERASSGYRRGYNDAARGKVAVDEKTLSYPWEVFDYREGYRAAANDKSWSEKRRAS
jgi:hypothetical protein